jgi:hypothetical protein
MKSPRYSRSPNPDDFPPRPACHLRLVRPDDAPLPTETQEAVRQALRAVPAQRLKRRGTGQSWFARDVRAGKVSPCLSFERLLIEACEAGAPLESVLGLITPLLDLVRARVAEREARAAATRAGYSLTIGHKRAA